MNTETWRTHRGVRSAVQWTVYIAPPVLLGIEGWRYRSTNDDGFIYFRVVHEIVAGHGPVFNPGHRVEAFTSPIWVALLTVIDIVTPFQLEWIAAVLGIACTVAGLCFAVAGAARLARRDAPSEMLLPLGALVLAALFPMWYWSTGGLETGLVFAWLGLSLWVLARWATTPSSRLPLWGAAIIGVGWLVRPELVVVSAVFVVAVAAAQWRADGWRARVWFLAAAGALPFAYEVFRMGYYGLLVSNTAIAKEGSKIRVHEGWLYLQDFFKPYALWIPVALVIFGAYLPLVLRLRNAHERRAMLVVGAFFTASVLATLGVVANGGDYLHARLLLPGFFALCAPVAVIPAKKQYIAVGAIAVWAAICASALRPPEARTKSGLAAGTVHYALPAFAVHRITVKDHGYGPDKPAQLWYRGPGIYVESNTNALMYTKIDLPKAANTGTADAAIYGLGAQGYAFPELFVLDLHGLADPLTAHLLLKERGYPGHEKTTPAAWVAALMTAPGTHPTLTEFDVKPVQTTPGGTAPFAVQVADARKALQCEPLKGLERSTTAAMSFHTFLSNVVHSFRRTTLRIPSDPVAAYEQYCSPTTPP